jgi:hypothetical protein
MAGFWIAPFLRSVPDIHTSIAPISENLVNRRNAPGPRRACARRLRCKHVFTVENPGNLRRSSSAPAHVINAAYNGGLNLLDSQDVCPERQACHTFPGRRSGRTRVSAEEDPKHPAWLDRIIRRVREILPGAEILLHVLSICQTTFSLIRPPRKPGRHERLGGTDVPP